MSPTHPPAAAVDEVAPREWAVLLLWLVALCVSTWWLAAHLDPPVSPKRLFGTGCTAVAAVACLSVIVERRVNVWILVACGALLFPCAVAALLLLDLVVTKVASIAGGIILTALCFGIVAGLFGGGAVVIIAGSIHPVQLHPSGAVRFGRRIAAAIGTGVLAGVGKWVLSTLKDKAK